MRIQRLDLVSYGAHRDRSLDLSGVPDGLVVLLGANEAGKSTVMRALDAFLFGIERGSPDHFGAGRESLRIGARVRSDAGAEVELVRQGLASRRLVDGTGAVVSEAVLAELVGHADRSLFRTMFRIDHRELTERSEDLLSANGEIGRLVFGASLGTVALSEVLDRLNTEARELFKARGHKPKLNGAISSYRQAAKDARAARVRPKHWADLDQDRQRSDQQASQLRARIDELRREHNRLEGVKATLAPLAARATIEDAITELTASGPTASPAWAARVSELESHLREIDQHQSRLARDGDAVAAKLSAAVGHPHLLEHARRVTDLHAQLGRYRKDVHDLPELRVKVSGLSRAVDRIRSQLGADRVDGPDGPRLLTDAEQTEIKARIDEYGTLIETHRSAVRESQAAADRLRTRQDDLDRCPEPASVSELDRAWRLARQAGPLDDQIESVRAELQSTEGTLRAMAGRLGLGGVSLEEIEARLVPGSSRVTEERTRRVDLDRDHQAWDQANRQRTDELVRLDQDRAELGELGGVPDRQDLERRRQHRDAGWAIIRARIEGTSGDVTAGTWTDGPEVPEAYEAAVADADAAADERYRHADQLARLEAIDRRRGELEAAGRRLHDEAADLDRRRQELDRAWAAAWEGVGHVPENPDAAQEWLADHTKFLDIRQRWRELQAETSRLEAIRDGHRESLSALIEPAGDPRVVRRLDELVVQAGEIVERVKVERSQHAERVAQLDEARRELQRRDDAADQARAALEDWRGAWTAALAPLGLGATTSVETARRTVELAGELAERSREFAELTKRCNGLDRDIAEFRRWATEVGNELAPDLGDLDAGDLVTELNRRLGDAEKAGARRQELAQQQEQLLAELEETDRRREQVSDELERLRRDAGLGPDQNLGDVADRSCRLARLRDNQEETDRSLLDTGRGRLIQEIIADAEAEHRDEDRITARLVDLERAIAELEPELSELDAHRGEIRVLLAQIDGTDRAAELDEQAAGHQADVARYLGEYVRAHLASAVLSGVIAAYGEAHQGPILAEATALFSALTNGAFVRLVPDDDGSRPVLLAERRNGELLGTAALSTGTRDQLYLAIRLAGVTHQLDRLPERLPLVLDDLLINFDDQRAEAALRVLADLGRQTQVLMFTHEPSLAQLAAGALGPGRCAVVELPDRDHDRTVVDPPGG